MRLYETDLESVPARARRADEHIMDVAYEWEEEKKTIDPAVYQQAAKDGLLTCLAFGTKIPRKWAKPDGTVFGGVKVDEWDGLCVHSRAVPFFLRTVH